MPPKKLTWASLGLFAGALAAVLVYFLLRSLGEPVPLCGMAATTVLMGVWWISAALPLAATSLLPLVAFPLFGINTPEGTAQNYMNSNIMLYLGGFLIAGAMERWNLHRRISLHIIAAVGHKPQRLVFGFLLAAAFLSMWISNTATAMMMVAIGIAVVNQVASSTRDQREEHLAIAIMLSIAYGASIGGVTTLIGTPTNLVLTSVYRNLFPDAAGISFGNWLMFALPLSAGLLLLVWFLLTRLFYPDLRHVALDPDYFHQQVRALPSLSPEERKVAIVFVTTCLLWIFRSDLVLGAFTLPGWSSLWPPLKNLDDGTVAIGLALSLFFLPCSPASGHQRILEEDAFKKLPWEIVLLFAGGFALANGFVKSGLSAEIGGLFAGLAGVHPVLVVLAVCLVVTFLTEFTSNVATASMVLPILAAIAPVLHLHPLALMVPATISASMAFMMPVATPPNAIVFSSGRVTIAQMARVGFVLNLLAALWILLLTQTLMPLVLPFG